MDVGHQQVARGQLFADDGQKTLVRLQQQDVSFEPAVPAGLLEQGGDHAAFQIGAFEIAHHAAARGKQGVGDEVGGGGFAVGAGDEDGVFPGHALDMAQQLRVHFQGHHAGEAGASFFVDQADEAGGQLARQHGAAKT